MSTMENESDLLKKLRYKNGRAAVINAPQGYELSIADDASLDGTYGFLLLYVNNSEEAAQRIPQVLPYLEEEALFWIAYPKKQGKFKPDINRDSLWALVDSISEYRAVSNVAVDEGWSAIRFRHRDKVKGK